MTENGAPDGPSGSITKSGYWKFVYPDGTPAEFSFIADGDGFRVESPLIPTPPPLPAYAIAQIEKARLEDEALQDTDVSSSTKIVTKVLPDQNLLKKIKKDNVVTNNNIISEENLSDEDKNVISLNNGKNEVNDIDESSSIFESYNRGENNFIKKLYSFQAQNKDALRPYFIS